MPVWFTWDGHVLYFATHEVSQKSKNLAHQPNVILHAGDGDDVIVLEGTAELVADQEEIRRVDADRGEKYVDPPTGARDTILVEGTGLYRVRPTHVMTWMYGDLRGRTDWWASDSIW
jgi:hypothetical protein